MEDRLVEIQDKRGTKDCPNLFANIVMKISNTMATVSGSSHKKVSVQALSEKEARELHKQLGILFDKIKLEPTNQVENEEPIKEAEEEKEEEEKQVIEDNIDEVKQDFSGVKNASTEDLEPDKETKEEVGTQKPTEVQEKGSESKGQSQTSTVHT